MHVYFITTSEHAERIAVEGFRDSDYGERGRGVMVQVTPVCVKSEGLTVIVVLVGDEPLEPYIDGDVACVPARLLNTGYAELLT